MALPNGFKLAPGEFLVQCPYEKAHLVTNSRLIVHLTKCRKNYLKKRQETGLSVEYVECKYNFYHKVLEPELEQHHATCPDQSNVVKFVQHRSKANRPFGFKMDHEFKYKDEVKDEGCKAEAGNPQENPSENKPTKPENDQLQNEAHENLQLKHNKTDMKDQVIRSTAHDPDKTEEKPNADQKPKSEPQYRFNQPGQSIMDERAYKYGLPDDIVTLADHVVPAFDEVLSDFDCPIKEKKEEPEQEDQKNLKRSANDEDFPEDGEYFEEGYDQEAQNYNYEQNPNMDPAEENWDAEDYWRAGAGEEGKPRRGYDPSVKLQSQAVLYHPHGLTKSERRKFHHCNVIRFHQRDFKPHRGLDADTKPNVKARPPSPSAMQPSKKAKLESD